jgi:hypothetical protein
MAAARAVLAFAVEDIRQWDCSWKHCKLSCCMPCAGFLVVASRVHDYADFPGGSQGRQLRVMVRI